MPCPYLKTCNIEVDALFFENRCNGDRYIDCQVYHIRKLKAMGCPMRIPRKWLKEPEEYDCEGLHD